MLLYYNNEISCTIIHYDFGAVIASWYLFALCPRTNIKINLNLETDRMFLFEIIVCVNFIFNVIWIFIEPLKKMKKCHVIDRQTNEEV